MCYASDTECLDESAPYLNVWDQEIGRKYEFKSINTIRSSVKGRLKRALHEWKLIDGPQFIIEVTEFGYKNKFKCEDIAVAKEVIKPDGYLFSFDGTSEIKLLCYDLMIYFT